MFTMSLHAGLLRRRTLGLAVLPLMVAVVAIILRFTVTGNERVQAFSTLTAELLVPLVTGLVALVVGVNAFGDEREEGTLPLLMATSTPRWRIVAAKVAAAWLATWIVCLPAVLACASLGVSTGLDGTAVVTGVLAASVLGAGGYVSLFVLLSLLVQRSVLVGLAYVVIWEGALAGYATSFRNLSVGAYGRRLVASAFSPEAVTFSVADVSAVVAALLLVALVAVAFCLGSWRLPRLEVH